MRIPPAVALGALVASLASAQSTPGEWLERMNAAVSSTNYEGTVIRHQRGDPEVLKVAYKIIDGVVNEKLVSQEGNGLEFIRIGDEVHCIMPDRKKVLVENWDNQNTLFSALPQSEIGEAPDYDILFEGRGRVAGRNAVKLSIRPHDEFRYGHRIWLDTETAFPLRTELVGVSGELIEQIKFASIDIGNDVSSDALKPSMPLDAFTWYREPSRYQRVEVAPDWVCDDLPPGFRAVSAHTEVVDEGGASTTHIVYSDGVASVSVFIGTNGDEALPGWSNVGTSNSYTVRDTDRHITAVGEVPGITVQRIATSMRPR